MEISVSEQDFEPRFVYYFYDLNGRLSSFKSNREINEGQIVFVNNFIDTHIMKVIRTWEENDKPFVQWEPSNEFDEIPLCVTEKNTEADWREWVAEADRKAQIEWAKEKGKKEAVRFVTNNLLDDGKSIEEIAMVLDYPVETLCQIIDEKEK